MPELSDLIFWGVMLFFGLIGALGMIDKAKTARHRSCPECGGCEKEAHFCGYMNRETKLLCHDYKSNVIPMRRK